MKREEMLSFGVFKPVGHVLVSLPDEQTARAASAAIVDAGIDPGQVHYLSDEEMLEGADTDLSRAGLGAGLGLNLIRAHRELARLGYHWLVVRAHDRDEAVMIGRIAEAHDAARAQYYGRAIVEELVKPRSDAGQRNESPELGLDSETPSRREAERTEPRK